MAWCNLLPFSLICPVELQLAGYVDPFFLFNGWINFFLNLAYIMEIVIFVVKFPISLFDGTGVERAEKEGYKLLVLTAFNLISVLYVPFYIWLMTLTIPFVGVNLFTSPTMTILALAIPMFVPIGIFYMA